MNEINKSVGKRIRDIRKSKSISIEKMAEKLNISYSTYQRIENGETNSWATHLEKISSLLEVSFEEIVIDKEKFVQINNEQSVGYFKSDIVINNLSERLIEQYELRIKEKDELIFDLKSKLEKFKD